MVGEWCAERSPCTRVRRPDVGEPMRAVRFFAALALVFGAATSARGQAGADIAPPERGPADARVTIVEFVDLTSELGTRFAFMADAVARLYPHDVRVVFRHSPDPSNAGAVLAHEAALAAAV